MDFRGRLSPSKIEVARGSKRKGQPARCFLVFHLLFTAIELLRERILFNPRQNFLGQLVKEDFFVLAEGVAFGGFAARAEEVAELASQIHLLLVRTFHFAFADQNARGSLAVVSFQELAFE